MKQPCFEAFEGVAFYRDAPMLTPSALWGLYDLWQAGQRVLASPVVVGHIALTSAEQRIVQGMQDTPATAYGPLGWHHPLWKEFSRVRHALHSIIARDVSRVENCTGALRTHLYGGYYHGTIDRGPPRSHNDGRSATLCWAVAHGASSLKGLAGIVCEDFLVTNNCPDYGKLEPYVPIDREHNLIPITFPQGAVVRFTASDLSANGPGAGGRIMHEAIMRVANPEEQRPSGILEAL